MNYAMRLFALLAQAGPGFVEIMKWVTGAGMTGLLLAGAWLWHKGTIRHEREVNKAENEAKECRVDRDRWITSFMANMEIVRKQGEAQEKLRESVEDLARVVGALAEETRRKG